MMKLIFIFVVLFTANTENSKRAVHSNWPLVEELVGEIQYLVHFTLLEIHRIAANDNPVVGNIIGAKVNDVAIEGMDLVYIVLAEVQAQTLSIIVAKIHLGELLVLITDLYADIETDLQDLSESAKTEIDSKFANLFLQVPGIANSIYDALGTEGPLNCGISGLLNNETIIPSDPLQSDIPPGTEVWKDNVYAVDYGFIPIHPHNKYLDLGISNDTLWFRSTIDFPNFIEETGMTKMQRVIQFHCVDGATVTYEFEFSIEDGPIVEPTLPPQD